MNAFNSVHFHSHSFTPISSSIHLKLHYADTRKIFVYVFVCVKAYEKHIIRIIFYRLWIVFCIVVAHFPPNLIQFKFIRNCFSVVFVFRSLCFTCISLSLSLLSVHAGASIIHFWWLPVFLLLLEMFEINRN